MNPPAAPSPSAGASSTSGPSAASWAYAETFGAESAAATAGRQTAGQLGVAPLGQGAASALTLLAKAIRAKAVVEIGTGTGVSGLALFAGMQPDGILTSVDIELQHQQAARRAFVSVGVATQRFRLINGAALNVLPRLSDGAYDLVYVDGDKLEYAEYVEEGLRLLRHGGLLVVNSALWHDLVADESNEDDETTAIRDALLAVQQNEDLISTLLPVGDGLLVAVKR